MDTITLLAAAAAFLAAVLTGHFLVPYLRKKKVEQIILEDGPAWHNKTKKGTPSMGGIIFILPLTLLSLILGIRDAAGGDARLLLIAGTALLFGILGFADDSKKLHMHRNKGVGPRTKLLFQTLIATGFIAAVYGLGYCDFSEISIFVPFFGAKLNLGYFALLLEVVAIVGTVNAVNLTDGIDGLASSVTIAASLFFVGLGAVCALTGGIIGSMDAVFCFAAMLAAALAAFLIFNFHPAKIFMGDTGSLYLGGAVSAMTLILSYEGANMVLLILPVGLVYLVEAMSDIIQVFWFKKTGKRVFKMAPIHHHFELCGWSEVMICTVFTGVTLLTGALTLLSMWGILR